MITLKLGCMISRIQFKKLIVIFLIQRNLNCTLLTYEQKELFKEILRLLVKQWEEFLRKIQLSKYQIQERLSMLEIKLSMVMMNFLMM
jgi:hypothetical protein